MTGQSPGARLCFRCATQSNGGVHGDEGGSDDEDVEDDDVIAPDTATAKVGQAATGKVHSPHGRRQASLNFLSCGASPQPYTAPAAHARTQAPQTPSGESAPDRAPAAGQPPSSFPQAAPAQAGSQQQEQGTPAVAPPAAPRQPPQQQQTGVGQAAGSGCQTPMGQTCADAVTSPGMQEPWANQTLREIFGAHLSPMQLLQQAIEEQPMESSSAAAGLPSTVAAQVTCAQQLIGTQPQVTSEKVTYNATQPTQMTAVGNPAVQHSPKESTGDLQGSPDEPRQPRSDSAHSSTITAGATQSAGPEVPPPPPLLPAAAPVQQMAGPAPSEEAAGAHTSAQDNGAVSEPALKEALAVVDSLIGGGKEQSACAAQQLQMAAVVLPGGLNSLPCLAQPAGASASGCAQNAGAAAVLSSPSGLRSALPVREPAIGRRLELGRLSGTSAGQPAGLRPATIARSVARKFEESHAAAAAAASQQAAPQPMEIDQAPHSNDIQVIFRECPGHSMQAKA